MFSLQISCLFRTSNIQLRRTQTIFRAHAFDGTFKTHETSSFVTGRATAEHFIFLLGAVLVLRVLSEGVVSDLPEVELSCKLRQDHTVKGNHFVNEMLVFTHLFYPVLLGSYLISHCLSCLEIPYFDFLVISFFDYVSPVFQHSNGLLLLIFI